MYTHRCAHMYMYVYIYIYTSLEFERHPPPLPQRNCALLTACLEEVKAGVAFPLAGPYRQEGATSADRLAESRNCKQHCSSQYDQRALRQKNMWTPPKHVFVCCRPAPYMTMSSHTSSHCSTRHAAQDTKHGAPFA